MADPYDIMSERDWANAPRASRILRADLARLKDGQSAGLTAASPRSEVARFLPKEQRVSQVKATVTWFVDISQQWAKPVHAIGGYGGGHRIALVAQVPAAATEPLKVAENTSLNDTYNPSNPRTNVPAGSEVSLSPGMYYLSAHYTTTPQAVRIIQITGV